MAPEVDGTEPGLDPDTNTKDQCCPYQKNSSYGGQSGGVVAAHDSMCKQCSSSVDVANIEGEHIRGTCVSYIAYTWHRPPEVQMLVDVAFLPVQARSLAKTFHPPRDVMGEGLLRRSVPTPYSAAYACLSMFSEPVYGKKQTAQVGIRQKEALANQPVV